MLIRAALVNRDWLYLAIVRRQETGMLEQLGNVSGASIERVLRYLRGRPEWTTEPKRRITPATGDGSGP